MARNAWKLLTGVWAAGLLHSGAMAAIAANIDGAAPPTPPAIENVRCLRCHADHEEKFVVRPDGSKNNIFVDTKMLDDSVHGKVPCTGCHRDVTKLPHAKPLAGAIGCVECHQQRLDQLKKDPDPKQRECLDVVVEQTQDYLHSAHAKPNPKNQAHTSMRPATTATTPTISASRARHSASSTA